MFKFFLFFLGIISSSLVFAATSGIGDIAARISENLDDIVKLIGGAAYLAGIVFSVSGIIKFKAHKDAPQQVPVSSGIVLLAVGTCLLFLPSLLDTAGDSLFGSSGTSQGASGNIPLGN